MNDYQIFRPAQAVKPVQFPERLVPGRRTLDCRNDQCKMKFANTRFGSDMRQQHEDLDHGQRFEPNP